MKRALFGLLLALFVPLAEAGSLKAVSAQTAGSIGALPTSGGTMTGLLTLHTTNLDSTTLSTSNGQTVVLTGNGTSILLKNSFVATSSSSTTAGFTEQLGMVSVTSGGSIGNGALYTGVEAGPGTGNAWSTNSLITIDSGAGINVKQFQGTELDFNNNDTADSDGIHFANGLNITGAGTHVANTALGIYGNKQGGGPNWLYGIQCGANNSVSIACMEVEGNSGYGLDFISFTGTSDIRMRNAGIIVGRNAANSADLTLLSLDASNVLQLGTGVATINFPGTLANFASANVINGNTLTTTIVQSGHTEDSNFNIQTITTGGSYTLPVTASHTNLHAAGTIATFTATEPAAPANGQIACIATDQIITALTLSANGGQSILGAPTTLPVGGKDCHRYRTADTTWYPY